MNNRFNEFLKEWAYGLSEEIVKDLENEVKNHIWFEANKLANEKRKQFEESSKLAKELYDKVPYELVAKNIKKSLPLNVRLLNKIEVTGKSLCEDTITYTYHFNGDFGYKFRYVATLTELKRLIE